MGGHNRHGWIPQNVRSQQQPQLGNIVISEPDDQQWNEAKQRTDDGCNKTTARCWSTRRTKLGSNLFGTIKQAVDA